MNGWLVALAVLGLLQGAVTLVIVAFLLNRVLRPIREIASYADETLQAGLAIARNLDDVGEAERIREQALTLAPVVKARFGNGGTPA